MSGKLLIPSLISLQKKILKNLKRQRTPVVNGIGVSMIDHDAICPPRGALKAKSPISIAGFTTSTTSRKMERAVMRIWRKRAGVCNPCYTAKSESWTV